MLVMLRLSLRVSEVCSLRASSVKWSHGRWTLRCKVKGGREEVWTLPKDVKEMIDHYLKLDRKRREIVHSGGEHAPSSSRTRTTGRSHWQATLDSYGTEDR